jgi:hypothetical protein
MEIEALKNGADMRLQVAENKIATGCANEPPHHEQAGDEGTGDGL